MRRDGAIVELSSQMSVEEIDKGPAREVVTRGPECGKLKNIH
jgi:hypothetical protein